MLVKVTTKNRLTLPKRMLDAVGHPTYFEVEIEEGRLVPTPAGTGLADAVRCKLDALGLNKSDVYDAVGWAKDQANP